MAKSISVVLLNLPINMNPCFLLTSFQTVYCGIFPPNYRTLLCNKLCLRDTSVRSSLSTYLWGLETGADCVVFRGHNCMATNQESFNTRVKGIYVVLHRCNNRSGKKYRRHTETTEGTRKEPKAHGNNRRHTETAQEVFYSESIIVALK